MEKSKLAGGKEKRRSVQAVTSKTEFRSGGDRGSNLSGSDRYIGNEAALCGEKGGTT